MINVGYLRNRKKPIQFVETLAIESIEKDINLVYFTPEDIDTEKKIVSGLVYRNGEWIEEIVRLPWFIDIHANLLGSKKYKELIAFLKKNVTLSAQKRFPLPRTRFEQYFDEESFFYDNVIVRKQVESLEDMKEMAMQYGMITMQPIRQRKEKNGYVVEHVQGDYRVYSQKDGELLPEGLLSEEVQQAIEEVRYGAEKFISPIEGTFEEADCNVQMEKGIEGNWQIVRMQMAREKKMTLQSYINEAFPEHASTLLEDIEAFVHHFAKTIEKIRKSSYMTISINIVIDKNGKIYVRQVSPNPSVAGIEEVVARMRAAYYSFIAPPLEMTLEEEVEWQKEHNANKKIEAELVDFHEEEERRRELIEQGLLEEEKSKFTIYNVLIFIAILFAIFRMTLRTF